MVHQVQSDIKRMQISDNHASLFSQLDLCTFKDLLNSLAKYVREDTTVEVFLLTETVKYIKVQFVTVYLLLSFL